MKELVKHISNLVDIALEEYITQKDHDEFISVLKYFIEIQATIHINIYSY